MNVLKLMILIANNKLFNKYNNFTHKNTIFDIIITFFLKINLLLLNLLSFYQINVNRLFFM